MKDLKICYIVGAGEINRPLHIPKKGDFVLAADGGLGWLKQNGIKPNAIIGDFDSLGFVPEDDEVLQYPVEKDYTDTHLCVDYALEKGYNLFIILGGLGGREDHTIANLQTLHYIAKNHARGILCDDTTEYTVISNGRLKINPDGKTGFSVFSLTDRSKGVSITGAKYTLDNATLTNTMPLGVSNKFTDRPVEISVTDGALCIYYSVEK